MNNGLYNLMQFTGDTLDNLWPVTSLNQAVALKIDNEKGSLKVGKDADIIIVNDDIEVLTTIKQGEIHKFN